MARGFGDASCSCPIFSSVSAPPLIWSTRGVVRRLTTSETRGNMFLLLNDSGKTQAPKVMRLAGAAILFNSQKITFSRASFPSRLSLFLYMLICLPTVCHFSTPILPVKVLDCHVPFDICSYLFLSGLYCLLLYHLSILVLLLVPFLIHFPVSNFFLLLQLSHPFKVSSSLPSHLPLYSFFYPQPLLSWLLSVTRNVSDENAIL